MFALLFPRPGPPVNTMQRFSPFTHALALVSLLAAAGASAAPHVVEQGSTRGSVERRPLEHGAQLLVLPDPEAEKVTVLLCFRGGRATEPESALGVASLTAAMIAGDATIVGSYGAWLASHSGMLDARAFDDEFRIELRVPAAALAEAATRLGDRLAKPSFEGLALERARAKLEAASRQRLADPAARADAALQALAYGPAWRAADRAGTGELRAISGEALVAFQLEQIVASRLVVGVTGPVETEAMVELWQKALGALLEGKAPPQSPPSFVQPSERRIWIVDDSTRGNVELRIAGAGVRWNDPDSAALELWSAIVANRIATATQAGEAPIEQAKASFERGASRKGLFLAAGAAPLEQVPKAVTWMLALLEGARGEIESGELARARETLEASAASERASSGEELLLAVRLALHGYPEDHPDQERARGLRLGPSDIQAAVARHLDPSRLLVVAVGPADRLMGPLAQLGRVARHEPLVDALLAAIGGRDRWARLTALEVEIMFQQAVGQYAPTHQWLDLDEPRFRVQTPMTNGTRNIVLDGRTAFERFGGEVTEYPADTVNMLLARHIRSLWNVLHHLAVGRGVTARQDGERRLVITCQEAVGLILELDEQYRPLRVMYEENGRQSTLHYEDWRETEGYSWAAHVHEEPSAFIWDITRFQPLRAFDPELVAR